MGKNNSLTYIKRYLNTFDNVTITECVNSTYYVIDDVKIRVSNHTKKQTKTNNKYDLSIIQPVNDDKQYVVIIKSSLAVLVMDLKGVKEFIRNYIYIQKMNRFEIPLYTEEMSEKEKEDKKIDTMREKKLASINENDRIDKISSDVLGSYLSENYKKWYNESVISVKMRRYLRLKLTEKKYTIKEMDKFLTTTFNERLNEISSKKINKEVIDKLMK